MKIISIYKNENHSRALLMGYYGLVHIVYHISWGLLISTSILIIVITGLVTAILSQ